MFGPRVVVLFWEILETLGSRTLLKEVGHWKHHAHGPSSLPFSALWPPRFEMLCAITPSLLRWTDASEMVSCNKYLSSFCHSNEKSN